MYENIELSIKQAHIDVGVRGSYWNCPIALALKEKFNPELCRVSVTNQFASISIPAYSIGEAIFSLDDAGKSFIPAFDTKQKVMPLKVTLTRVNGSLDLGVLGPNGGNGRI